MSGSDCAVCYVTDINYLLPSLVSAAGVRRFVPAHRADIFVFLVEEEEQRAREFNEALAPLDIRVEALDSRSYAAVDSAESRGSYISAATLGRFILDERLPAACKRIVYLDGDTWIRRDPSALIEASVPEGRLAAVEDMISFRSNPLTPSGRSTVAYFRGLGLDRADGYFNAGVFAVERKTWRALAAEAVDFLKRNMARCRFYDQSALNAVTKDRRLPLSLKWNFTSPCRFTGLEDRIAPAVYHFTQYTKPWMGACKPWQELFAPYQRALAPFETLSLPIKRLDAAEVAAHNRLNLPKNVLLGAPAVARLASLPMRIRRYESSAWL